MPRPPPHLPIVLCSLLLTLPSGASAYDHELQVGGDLLYAHFFDENADVNGGGVGLRARWGLTDALAVAGGLDWAVHSVTPLEGTGQPLVRQVGTATVGVQWAVDSFDFVPFLNVGLGASILLQDDLVVLSFLLDLGGGIDWRATDSLSVGVSVDYQLFFGSIEVPSRLLVGARVSWRWTRRAERP